MNLKFFIERPIFSAVISITLIILGAIGLATLPVEQFPDIAPPDGASQHNLLRSKCRNNTKECDSTA